MKKDNLFDDEARPDLLTTFLVSEVVLFPGVTLSLVVNHSLSIAAIDYATKYNDGYIIVAHLNIPFDKTDISKIQINNRVTLAKLLQVSHHSDGTVKVLVEGKQRAAVKEFLPDEEKNIIFSTFFLITNLPLNDFSKARQRSILAQGKEIYDLFKEYVDLNQKIPLEVIKYLGNIKDPGEMSDLMASHATLSTKEGQILLNAADVSERLAILREILDREITLATLDQRISRRVHRQISQQQKQFLLQQQMHAIQKELGTENGPAGIGHQDFYKTEQLKKRVKDSKMSAEAQTKALEEIERLRMMQPMSPEATVAQTYVQFLLKLPWKKISKVNFNLKKVEKILEKNHSGLNKIKERIIEYTAVFSRLEKIKGPILCLIGPPGVGKTSLGKSMADALGLKFARFSLGGIRDEADIRGHRRTYVGSMPGRISQALMKQGTNNPLFLLDEVDKMSHDQRGDPASALLEVLDPEQNSHFVDHYLDVEYDLSQVLFLVTANDAKNIPPALYDRMEILELSGYTEDEKLRISKKHIIPKQVSENGLKRGEIRFSDEAIYSIIRDYTCEPGVRDLERSIGKICRKVVRRLVDSEGDQRSSSEEESTRGVEKKILNIISKRTLTEFLGVAKYHHQDRITEGIVGQVNALAWTGAGGELLTIEVATTQGKGKVLMTGKLGDVMKESVQAALTVIKSRAASLSIKPELFDCRNIHIHVPEGATSKDGPSAGIAICLAMISSFTNQAIRSNVAMTGEITLRGEILPIGGLQEKLLAARRVGMERVLIPKKNEINLKEIPAEVYSDIVIHPVKWIDEVLSILSII